jgi:hypothetical protein
LNVDIEKVRGVEGSFEIVIVWQLFECHKVREGAEVAQRRAMVFLNGKYHFLLDLYAKGQRYFDVPKLQRENISRPPVSGWRLSVSPCRLMVYSHQRVPGNISTITGTVVVACSQDSRWRKSVIEETNAMPGDR